MFSTLPQMLRAVVEANFKSTFAYRERGQWHYISTKSFRDQVANLALALEKMGLKKGDTVAIMAEPSPFWLMVDLAVMALGAVTVPIFAHIAPDILRYQLEDADVHWCFADGEEQWQLALSEKQRWRGAVVRAVQTEVSFAYELPTLLHMGAQETLRRPEAYRHLVDALSAADLATIIYTSGSTGMPKGVCLSQGNITSQLHAAAQRYPLDPDHDKALSCLPLAHVFERMVMYFYVSKGISVVFADDIQQVGNLLREIKPTCVTMVPRLLEKVYARILTKAEESHFLKRKIAQWAFSEARENDPVTARETWSFQIAESLVYQQLREALGGKIKYIIVGGARLSPDLQRFFLNIGLPIYTGYGMSEASPVLAANYPGHNRVNSVGPVFPGVELKIGENQEILARGANVMLGYLGLPEKTAAIIDSEGWLHTGDCGQLNDGYLTITGRIKELMKTSNGKYVAPVPIEQKICESPIVDMAMVVAEGRTFVSCLFFPDFEIIKQLKQVNNQSHTSDADFLSSVFIKNAMDSLLTTVNAELNHWEQIRDYRFILEVPSIDGGELTPTMKVRRHIIEEKFAALITDLYKEA